MYRLLIADNNETLVSEILEIGDWKRMGFQLSSAAYSYAEALRAGLDQKPDLALIEGDLDGGRGLELIRQLRTAAPDTICCAMLRPAEMSQLREYMRAGARDYLCKPVDRRDLVSLQRWTLSDVLRPVTESSVPDQAVDPVLEKSYGEMSQSTVKLITIAQSRFRTSLCLTDLAADLGMSSKYIGRIFQKDTGIRFSNYLMAYRMRQARRLILTTREKISVIATMVGYTQPNNFYIHFRGYYGMSPSALREYANNAEGTQEVPNEKSI